jgi:hypothetical protein
MARTLGKPHTPADDKTENYLEKAAEVYAAMHGSGIDVGASGRVGTYYFTVRGSEHSAHEAILTRDEGLIIRPCATISGQNLAGLLIEMAAKYLIIGKGFGLQEAELRAHAKEHPPTAAKPEPATEAPPEVPR